jgi:carboxypeptidase Q
MRLVVLLVPILACAPRVSSPSLPEDTTARDLACSLADEVGPRLSGSPGDSRAVAWALAKMTALGLSNVHAEPVKVPHWERGDSFAEVVAPVTRRLHLVALGGSVATPDGGVEAEVIAVPNLEALRSVPREQVEGRIVFFDKVMERSPTGKGYGGTVDVRRSGAAEAAKKGAVASLIRSVGTSDARFPHTGSMRYDADPAVEKIPAAALAIPDAELLRRLLSRGGPVRLKLLLTPRSLP